MNVGVIGVGAMGGGMVRALLRKGFRVVVRDLVAQREDEAVAAGAVVAASPAEVARQVDVVVTVVVDAQQTRDVLDTGDRLFFSSLEKKSLSPVVMMCSTIAPADASDMAAKLAAQGIAMLDAPISGGPARAREGTLSMMASGAEEAFGACERVIAALTARCFRIGAVPGDGSRMKVVNNMLAAANLAAGCEAMAMASKLGLDLRQVADVVNASSGQSWIFADRMARALEGDYAPRAAARVLCSRTWGCSWARRAISGSRRPWPNAPARSSTTRWRAGWPRKTMPRCSSATRKRGRRSCPRECHFIVEPVSP